MLISPMVARMRRKQGLAGDLAHAQLPEPLGALVPVDERLLDLLEVALHQFVGGVVQLPVDGQGDRELVLAVVQVLVAAHHLLPRRPVVVFDRPVAVEVHPAEDGRPLARLVPAVPHARRQDQESLRLDADLIRADRDVQRAGMHEDDVEGVGQGPLLVGVAGPVDRSSGDDEIGDRRRGDVNKLFHKSQFRCIGHRGPIFIEKPCSAISCYRS